MQAETLDFFALYAKISSLHGALWYATKIIGKSSASLPQPPLPLGSDEIMPPFGKALRPLWSSKSGDRPATVNTVSVGSGCRFSYT